jgi:hypothetical protein
MVFMCVCVCRGSLTSVWRPVDRKQRAPLAGEHLECVARSPSAGLRLAARGRTYLSGSLVNYDTHLLEGNPSATRVDADRAMGFLSSCLIAAAVVDPRFRTSKPPADPIRIRTLKQPATGVRSTITDGAAATQLSCKIVGFFPFPSHAARGPLYWAFKDTHQAVVVKCGEERLFVDFMTAGGASHPVWWEERLRWLVLLGGRIDGELRIKDRSVGEPVASASKLERLRAWMDGYDVRMHLCKERRLRTECCHRLARLPPPAAAAAAPTVACSECVARRRQQLSDIRVPHAARGGAAQRGRRLRARQRARRGGRAARRR